MAAERTAKLTACFRRRHAPQEHAPCEGGTANAQCCIQRLRVANACTALARGRTMPEPRHRVGVVWQASDVLRRLPRCGLKCERSAPHLKGTERRRKPAGWKEEAATEDECHPLKQPHRARTRRHLYGEYREQHLAVTLPHRNGIDSSGETPEVAAPPDLCELPHHPPRVSEHCWSCAHS
jgi:hypothetical protein